MNEILTVRSGECVKDRFCDGKRLADRKRAFTSEVSAKVAAVDILHREIGDLAVGALVVNTHHAGVGKASRSFRFSAKPGCKLMAFGLGT